MNVPLSDYAELMDINERLRSELEAVKAENGRLQNRMEAMGIGESVGVLVAYEGGNGIEFRGVKRSWSLPAGTYSLYLGGTLPEGWKRVPIEPTEAMNLAAEKNCASWWTDGRTTPVYGHEPKFLYQAMLEAAPEPK